MKKDSFVSRHAYCIIAHNEPEVLAILVRMIDDPRNDIFIHIDAKVRETSQFHNIVKAIYSRVFFLENRIFVEWSHVSQIECEMQLFETAHNIEKYSYYHLLSGVDLPIKTQDEIHAFFDSINGKEVVGFAKGENVEKDIEFKTRYYHFFCNWIKNPVWVKKIVGKTFLKFFPLFQRFVGISRHKNYKFSKGTNWVSITDNLVQHLIAHKSEILNRFRYTYCADELFIPSEIYNSNFRDNIYAYDLPEFDGCKRLIDWNRGNPYVWKMSDLEELLSSDKLFARKFSSKEMSIVKALEKIILSK